MTADAAAGGKAVRSRKKGAEAAPAAAAWPSARTAYYTLFVLILSTTCSQLDIAIVPYLGPMIKADLHLSDYSFSLMVGAAFGLFYTLVGIPLAWVLDRFSRKRLLALAITVWSLGTAACGLTQNFWQLCAARFVVGAGEAVNGPAAYSITSDLMPRERMPRAIAILQLGSIGGPAITTLIGAFALAAFTRMTPLHGPFGPIHGWQVIFMLVGLPGVLISLLMLFTMQEPKRHTIPNQVTGLAETPTNLGAAIVQVFKDYGVALAYIGKHWKVFGPMFGSLFVGSLGTGALAFHAIFFKRQFGWEPAKLAGLNIIPNFVLVPLGLLIGAMVAEYFTRKGRADAALLTQILGRLVGFGSMFGVLMPSPWAAWGLITLMIFSIGLSGPAQNAAFQIVTPTELRGKMTALFLFIYSVVGVAFAPVITGFISTYLVGEGNLKLAIFLPAAIFGPASLIITLLGLKPYGREVERLKALEAGAVG
jgi:MFS family permease